MNPSSPSQISSTTSSSFPSNDYMMQICSKISSFIQNSQIPELSQFITMNYIPPTILTQFLSNLIDNPQNIEIIKLFLSKDIYEVNKLTQKLNEYNKLISKIG